MHELGVRVAVIQTQPRRAEIDRNRRDALSKIEEAMADGCRLIALPECAISGYAIDDPTEAMRLAEPLDGPSVTAVARLCARSGASVVFGLLERSGDRLFNSAVLVGPAGLVGVHRKGHIVRVAADAHVEHGSEINVFEAGGIRIGMMICYEVRFPEVARVMALAGAQLIVVVANWPAGADVNPDILSPARAAENNVHLLAANRCGTAGALSFIGKSTIHLPDGTRAARAGTGEETLVADLVAGPGLATRDVRESRYAVDLRGHRRPELYSAITNRTSGT